jgi:hypothetical protein
MGQRTGRWQADFRVLFCLYILVAGSDVEVVGRVVVLVTGPEYSWALLPSPEQAVRMVPEPAQTGPAIKLREVVEGDG